MKQKLLASAAIILGAALAAPAAADISLTGTVIYDKEVRVTETLRKTKTVTITVLVDRDLQNAAESNAVVNQRIGGTGTDGPAPGAGFSPNSHFYAGSGFATAPGRSGIDYFAATTGSVIRNLGVTQYNQDVGVGVNQNNLLSAAAAQTGLFIEANNAAAQYLFNNTVTINGRRTQGTDTTADDTVGHIHSAQMGASVNFNLGVTQVNQNAGVFNNQLNSMSLAFSFNDSAVALANSDLGQWNAGGLVTETNTTRSAAIVTSVNNNIGVVMGNQSAGHMGNQANIVSLSAGGLF